ncbi:MAG: PAS domain-containing protein [Anaerolineae bacterium]|nr:PAS domain-containing protein [Anaerolineae bacterium]
MDSFSFPPYAPAYLVNFFLTIFIVVIALRRRRAQGALAFAGVMSTAAIWSFAQFFESGATTVQGRIFWSQVQYIGATTVAVAWFAFAIRYSGLHFLEGRRIAVLFIFPAITLTLVWTNSLHHLIWAEVRIVDGPIILAVYDHGLWFWLHILYSYTLVITGSVLLVRESIYAPRLRQYQTLALVTGAVAPLIANVMYLLELTPLPGLDLTAFAFTVTGLLYLPALYNLRVLDITPVARGAIIDQMSDSVIVTDTQHRIVDVNAAVGELLSTDISGWFGQPLAEALSVFPELAALSADNDQAQVIVTTATTPARTLDVRRTALNDRHNQPVGTLFLLRDISQLRLAEQQSFDLALEHERVRLLSRFIRDASHEFRTPLAVINTSLYLMDRSPDAAVKHAQQEKIEAQVKRIDSLLDDMLTMSRLDEREPLTLTNVDLNALIRETVEAMRNPAVRQPAIHLNLAEALPPVRGDQAQLQRVIESLLRNALDFTNCEGTVTLSSSERGDFIIFSLNDTGAGMDATAQRHVFERFFRSDEAHSTPGLGLGLPITRAIVEAHGGLIEAVSAPGKGSTFTVQLPARPLSPAPERPAAPYRLHAPLHPRSEPAIETP